MASYPSSGISNSILHLVIHHVPWVHLQWHFVAIHLLFLLSTFFDCEMDNCFAFTTHCWSNHWISIIFGIVYIYIYIYRLSFHFAPVIFPFFSSWCMLTLRVHLHWWAIEWMDDGPVVYLGGWLRKGARLGESKCTFISHIGYAQIVWVLIQQYHIHKNSTIACKDQRPTNKHIL